MAVGKRSSKRPLQQVLGKGANVNADNPLEVHDPKVGSLISYEGVTTADGAGDGSSLIDSVLTTKPDYDGHWVVITSGPYLGQCSDITAATTGGTVTVHEAFDGQIVSRTKFVILAMKALPAEVAALQATCNAIKTLVDALDLTTFKQETHAAVNAEGTDWVDLLDKSTITRPTKICGFKVTVSAGWTGKARVRITDGAGTTKIFPFQAYYEQDAGFTSGTQVVFNFAVVVPVADGYKVQFCSSNGADGAGNTVTLDNLDVIEVG